MGMLAENKSRRKISNDPNNTKWTRDESKFGQKILRSQGWQPGQFLGAQNAPHSELHTAANASYIRVVLKDDMKGLGFNKAKEDEVTGLDVFSDLLSRLNGKSEESIETDKQAKLAVKTNFYVEQKYGAMRFVRGGLLVGDKVMEEETKSEDNKEDTEGDVKMEDTPAEEESKKSKKNKKRKAIEDDDDDNNNEDSSKKSKKRRKEDDESRKSKKDKKKSKKSKSEPVSEDEDDTTLSEKKKRKAKKSKSDSEDDKLKEAKKQSKKDKKEKKEKKKEKKEKKKEKKRRKEAESSDSDSDSSGGSASEKDTAGGESTPAASGSGTSTPLGSRNFVRSRFIAQKKQAVMDAKALNQIFMLKT